MSKNDLDTRLLRNNTYVVELRIILNVMFCTYGFIYDLFSIYYMRYWKWSSFSCKYKFTRFVIFPYVFGSISSVLLAHFSIMESRNSGNELVF